MFREGQARQGCLSVCTQSFKHGYLKSATQSRCTMQRHKWLTRQGCETQKSTHSHSPTNIPTIHHNLTNLPNKKSAICIKQRILYIQFSALVKMVFRKEPADNVTSRQSPTIKTANLNRLTPAKKRSQLTAMTATY